MVPVDDPLKRAEHAVELWAPERFESLYELVSFTTVPYAEARRRAAVQRRFPANVAAVGAAGPPGSPMSCTRRCGDERHDCWRAAAALDTVLS